MLLLHGTSITSLRNAFSALRNSAWVVRKSHIVPLTLILFFGTCSVDQLLLHPQLNHKSFAQAVVALFSAFQFC